MSLTRFEALVGELEPYTPSRITLEKALTDSKVDWTVSYEASDKRIIAVAAVAVLKKMVVLTSDSVGKSSQGYSVDGLKKRIQALCRENDIEDESDLVGLSSVTDASNMW